MILPTNYCSGFCFHNESELFKEYLHSNDFTVAGFSYGAQKAFEMALHSSKRVDTLQLLSPAFFQNKDEKYKRMQLMFFQKDAKTYCENFLKNSSYPTTKEVESYFSQGTYEELDALLHYVWDENKLEELLKKGTKIEVFLGTKDKIIDSNSAYDFFKAFACVYYIKDVGHLL
ncbi:MAG: pimelyl-ACP methyl ester esterase BioV [Arcobacteraceae bacterium]